MAIIALEDINITNIRAGLKQQFLTKHGFGHYTADILPADASLRQYTRLSYLDRSFILMDCPPEYTSLEPFINISNYLASYDFSTPTIFHADHDNGFLILEDFGAITINYLLATKYSQDLENYIYKKTIRLLSAIQAVPLKEDLSHHSVGLLVDKAALFIDWFLPILNNEITSTHEIRQEYCEIWHKILTSVNLNWQCLTLRDFHVDNLMYITERQDIRKIGLLDFQDASIGSPAYDLVSLLQDARRDIKLDLASEMINYYLDLNPQYNRKEFLALYAVLGAQRSLRILGIFARKAMQDKNSKYLSYVPRVRKYLDKNLTHPLLAPLQHWLQKHLR